MPTIWNPFAAYSFWSSISQGVSILHGPHHVAQKLISSGLPLKLESETVCPLRFSRTKSGAALPTREDWLGTSPATEGMSSPCEAEASARSAACFRYSQLAQPAHANVARIKNVTPRTMVLRFTGDRTSLYLLYEERQWAVNSAKRTTSGCKSRKFNHSWANPEPVTDTLKPVVSPNHRRLTTIHCSLSTVH